MRCYVKFWETEKSQELSSSQPKEPGFDAVGHVAWPVLLSEQLLIPHKMSLLQSEGFTSHFL